MFTLQASIPPIRLPDVASAPASDCGEAEATLPPVGVLKPASAFKRT